VLESIKGTVVARSRDSVVIETSGFEFRLRMPKGAAEALAHDERIKLYCHVLLRDDQFHLFGFVERVQRDVFLVLLGVPGLGPEKALALLGAKSPAAIAAAVRDEAPRQFEIIRGIGARLAQRIVLELKGKLEALALPDDAVAAGGTVLADLVSTLTHLGYSRTLADAAARTALLDVGLDADIESLVKSALRSLQRAGSS